MNTKGIRQEAIRIFVFLAIIAAVIFFGWWTLFIAIFFFPKTLIRLRNKRNGKINIGYLVNYLTNRLAK